MEKINRSIYFGGSFDPPHLGHLEMLLSLARDSWTENVFVVPTSVNPLKAPQIGELWSSAQHRLQWVGAMIEEAKECLREEDAKKIKLCTIEIERPGETAFTVDTLSKLRHEFSGIDSWSLAIGSDLLPSLPKWKELDRLLSLLESVWVFPRGDDKDLSSLIPDKYQHLCPFRIMAQQVPSVSSTEIRQKLITVDDAASCKNLIPERVLESIKPLL